MSGEYLEAQEQERIRKQNALEQQRLQAQEVAITDAAGPAAQEQYGAKPRQEVAISQKLFDISKAKLGAAVTQQSEMITKAKTEYDRAITEQQVIVDEGLKTLKSSFKYSDPDYIPKWLKPAVDNLARLKGDRVALDEASLQLASAVADVSRRQGLTQAQLNLIKARVEGGSQVREYLRHPSEKVVVTYTEDGQQRTRTFDSVYDAEVFAVRVAAGSARYTVTARDEKGKESKVTFKTPDAAQRYIEALSEPSVKAQRGFKAIPGPAASKGLVNLTPYIDALDDYGVKMNAAAVKEKLAGNSLAAGVLYASGAAVRFATGFVTGPIHTPELVYTLATNPRKVGEVLAADPLVTAMTLATLGLSAVEVAKSLNKRFGITNKAYAAKLADSAFDIVTKEDRAFYYPGETQAPGFETVDFNAYAQRLKDARYKGLKIGNEYILSPGPIEVTETGPKTITGKAGTWRFEDGRLVYQYNSTPDIIFSEVSGEAAPVKPTVKAATLEAITSERIANAEVKWLNTITQQQYDATVAALKAARETSGAVEASGKSGSLVSVLEEAKKAGAPGTFSVNEARLQIIYVPPDVGFGSFPVVITPALIRDLYKNDAAVARLTDAQLIESAPILLNFAPPDEVSRQVEQLDTKTQITVIPLLDKASIQQLEPRTIVDVLARLDSETRSEVVSSLSSAQVEAVKELAPQLTETITELSIGTISPPPTTAELKVSKDLDDDEIMDRAEIKGKPQRPMRFRVVYGGKTSIKKANNHHGALSQAVAETPGRFGYADVLKLP